MNTMTSCSRCGKSAPRRDCMGLCPDCLLAAGLGSVADATAAGAAKHFTPPEIADLAPLFPQLEIDGLLGCGGMGAVYKARQKNLDRSVALKILPPDIGRDPAFAQRFAREAKALAKLNHPNIVTLYEFGQAGELFYFLMEYVDGVNLRQLILEGRVASREALAIVPQICDALQYAHDQGIVHRDIKPENILLDRRGRVKVADFGLAKLVRLTDQTDQSDRTDQSDLRAEVSQPSLIMGTPAYMAPEQRDRPAEVDHRADIYSLGVVFYQMLTGELPGKFLEAPSKKVTIDVRLDEVVLRALEQKPERRYQQVSEVRTSLEIINTAPANKASAGIEQGGKPGFASTMAFIILYAAYVAMVLTTASQLPERVATHFGFEGRADGWMSRNVYQIFEITFPLVIGLIFTGTSAMIRFFPAKYVNLPRKDFWLVPERRALTASIIRSRMTWLACLMTLFFGGLHVLTLEANRVQPPQLPMGGLLMVVMFFLISLMIWVILLLMRFAETGEGCLRSEPSAEALDRKCNGWQKMMAKIVLAVLIGLALKQWVIGSYTIKNNSLAPELPAGSLVLAWKQTKLYKQGDLVVYRMEKFFYAGRVQEIVPGQMLLSRNGVSDIRVQREALVGRVMTVLWRGSGNVAQKQLSDMSVQTKSPFPTPREGTRSSPENPRNVSVPMLSWAEGVLLIVGGIFLCVLVAVVVLLVIWIRKAKSGPGKSVAIGCGVAFLVGLVFVLLSVGLTFAWWSQTRTNLRREMEANQQHVKDEEVRRHQQQQIEREETTHVRSLRQ
ncbi:MAG: protein kinase [bacterium]